MCNTLKEAVSYMYENGSTDLVGGCLDMLVSINSTLAEYNIADIESILVLSDELNSQNLNLPEIYNKIIDLLNIKNGKYFELWNAQAQYYNESTENMT